MLGRSQEHLKAGAPPLGQDLPVSIPGQLQRPPTPAPTRTSSGSWVSLSFLTPLAGPSGALEGVSGWARPGFCTPPRACRLRPQEGSPPNSVLCQPDSGKAAPLCSEQGEATTKVGLRVVPQETTRRASWRRQ